MSGVTTVGNWESIVKDVAVYTVGNLVLNFFIRMGLKYYPKTASIPPKKRSRAILYVISFINAAASSGYGVHHYLTGAHGTLTEQTQLDKAYTVVAFVTGYFVADFFCVLPDMFTYPQDVFHHIVGMFLGFGALAKLDTLWQVVPAFSLQELSTLPLNLMWFAKEFQFFRQFFNPDICRQFFGYTFLLTRMIFLPYVYATQVSNSVIIPTTNVNISMIVFIGLQYYWGFGFMKKAGFFDLMRRLLGMEKRAPKAKGAAAAADTKSQ